MNTKLSNYFHTIMDYRIVASNIVFLHHHCSFSFLDEKFKNFILQEPLEYCLTLRTFGEILKSYTEGRGIMSTDSMLKRVCKPGIENRNPESYSEYFHPIDERCTAQYGKYPNLPLLFNNEAVKKDCSDLFSHQFMYEATTPMCKHLDFYQYLRIYQTIPEIKNKVVRENQIHIMSVAEMVNRYADVLIRRHFYSPNIVTNVKAHSEKYQEKIKGNYSIEEYYFTLI